MTIIGVISEIFLYICISLVMGAFFLSIIPEERKPIIHIPKKIVVLSILGVAVFSFHPVLRLIVILAEDYELFITIQSVLFSFEVGKGWLLTCFLSIVFFFYYVMIDVKKEPAYVVIGLIFTLLLIVAGGWASHSSSLSTKGFVIHTIHFLAVSIWVGVLLVVSWFSRQKGNWLLFLKWFSPVAIVCFLTILVSGFLLMKLVVNPSEYTRVWALSYGQSLLVKHLFIIPLFVYAFINSRLVKNRLKDNKAFNPISWAKVESIVLLFVFSATAVLGQQSPPHSIDQSLKTEGPATLFQYVYNGNVGEGLTGSIDIGFYSLFLLLVSLLFLSLIIIAFLKKITPAVTVVFSVFFVFTSYIALMISLV